MISTTSQPPALASDRAVAERDALLDSHAMSRRLSVLLGRQVHKCVRARTKYRVGESLRVAYRLATDIGDVLVALRTFGPLSAHQYMAATSSGSAPLHLPELSAVAWVFPDDRKLAALSTVWTDHSVLTAALGVEIDHLELVSYSPEKSVAIRCSFDTTTVAYVKVLAENSVQVERRYRVLAPWLATCGVTVPHVVAAQEDLGLVALSPVHGDTLASHGSSRAWRELGRAAARLHQPVPSAARHVLAPFARAALPRLRQGSELIAMARPDVAESVGALVHELEARSALANDLQEVVLHGDLHAKNVIVAGDGLGFIDLDQAATGAAAAELGSAIAALRYEAVLNGSADSARWLAREKALLAGYSELGTPPDNDVLAWHIAAALLGERALRAVNRIRTEGLGRLPELISLARRTIESHSCLH